MAKPKGPLSQARAFRRVIEKYTGISYIRRPLRAIVPRIPLFWLPRIPL